MMDAETIAAMDEWCKNRCKKISEATEKHITGNGPLDDPELLRLVGESRGYHAMRSFLHGFLRNA